MLLRVSLNLFLIMSCEATNGKTSLMSCWQWIMVFITYNISKKNQRKKCTFFCIICNGGDQWVIHICIFVTHVSRSISVHLHDSQYTHTCIEVGAEMLYGPSPQKAKNIFCPYQCNLICFSPSVHSKLIPMNLIEPTKE